MIQSTAFCCLSSERLPALWTICLFGCLACVRAFVCFALVPTVHTVVIVCAGDIPIKVSKCIQTY